MAADQENWTYKLRTKGNTLGGKNKPQANSRRPRPVVTEEELAEQLKAKSLEQLSTLSTKLSELISSFKLTKLDFQPTSTSDSIKLAFTSQNAPFLAFEDSLTRLLIELDGVESGGNEIIRNGRKKLVKEIENELSKLEVIKQNEFNKQQSNQGQVNGLKQKKDKVDEMLKNVNGKELPEVPITDNESPTTSLKRAEDERSPKTGTKQFKQGVPTSNGVKEANSDRYTKVRKQESNESTNDLPLFARLPSRFD